MKVCRLYTRCSVRNILPCMQGRNSAGSSCTAKGIFYAIQVEFNSGMVVFGKGCSLCNSLKEALSFMNENIFIRYEVNERIVHHIQPYVLCKIVFVQGYHAIFLKIPVFF